MIFTDKKISFFLLLSALFSNVLYAANEPKIFRPEKRDAKIEAVDTTKTNNIHLNVNIFGDIPVGSYYILWDEMDLSDEMKKLMTTRDFATDEFFMQNIDREEFEQARMLLLFEDRKREFFRMYPEEALKELEEEKADE